MDFCTIDRKERTVYVTGMHPRCNENTIFDLFSRTGYVEKVVLHITEEGNPHYCLVVYRDPESVMYTISQLNGHRLLGQSLNLRPLRESSHAAVLQRAIIRRRNPLHQQQNIDWTYHNPSNPNSVSILASTSPPQGMLSSSSGGPQYLNAMGGGRNGGYFEGYGNTLGGYQAWCNSRRQNGGQYWNHSANSQQPAMQQ